MDDHRSVSVSRVYVPNEYSVFLSTVDREQFVGYEEQLCEELQDYLAEHARRERYVLLSSPVVKLDTDDDLDMGMFGIATRLAPVPAPERPPLPPPTATMIYRPVELPPELPAVESTGPLPEQSAFLVVGHQKHRLAKSTVVLGRSKDSDIQVMDPNVSRRHAEIRRVGATYTVADLDSTNGIEVGGRRVKEFTLEDGSRFTLGSTEILFSLETH
jgi:pSer/pThr/pTyr-binding forkhead associated (FHA) protein